MMKKLLLLFLLFVSATAFAEDVSFYTGVQLGQSKIDSTASNLNAQSVLLLSTPSMMVSGPSSVEVNNDGFAGRAFAGLRFSPYISLEGGYTQYAGVKIKNIYGITGKDAQLNEGAIDTVLKLTLPLTKKASLYGKGGEAFVMTNQLENAYVTSPVSSPNFANSLSYDEESVDRFRPTYTVGLDYKITSLISSNFSFSRVIGGDGVPTSDLLSLGISVYLLGNIDR